MDLGALLHHYFGTDELDGLDEAALQTGAERLAIDFGIEREPGRRFALWSLMHSLDIAPDPATAFKTSREREAAYEYARLAARAERS